MGYVAARGGLDAIKAAEALVRRKRTEAASPGLGIDQLVDRQRLAVDRVMGEGGLWDPDTAARALRQAEGDPIEAAHLVRAYRSTLPRLAYSRPTGPEALRVLRRIVPAFRTPPGPQLLGRTTDYGGRLLELTQRDTGTCDVDPGPDAALRAGPAEARNEPAPLPPATGEPSPPPDRRPTRLYELLRKMDLVVDRRTGDDTEPFDITRTPPRPGAPRSARLAVMARAETGALVQLWYRNILGPDNHLHEVTLGEVRHGHLPVRVTHPLTGRPFDVGEVRVTEVEAIEDLDGPDEETDRFDVGYGMVMGHNERKAIAMANLDIAVHRDRGRSPLEQSILQTTDGLDASGFLEHLKLPHYVTFRSMVERKHARRAAEPVEVGAPPVGGRRDGAEIEVECR